MPVLFVRRFLRLAILLGTMTIAGASRAEDMTPKSTAVVPLTLVGAFSDLQRAKVLRAVNEWNVALNGQLRFELGADADRPSTWAIMTVMESPRHNGPREV